jgi:heme-degrading monooxygenase HmoA
MKKRTFLIPLLLALVLPGASSLIARQERPAPRAIARIWRGRTLASKADEYQAYLDGSGISRVRATPGNLGVTVLRRNDGGKTEFLVLSLWESVDAIKKFAGEDYQKAVILPRDREYLLEVEPNVLHYEILREERKK